MSRRFVLRVRNALAPPTPGTYNVSASDGAEVGDEASNTVTGAENWQVDEHLPSGAWDLEEVNEWATKSWPEATNSGTPQTIVTVSDPTGGSSALRQDWDGVPDGSGPALCYYNVVGGEEFFFSEVMQLEEGFTPPPNEIKGITMGMEPGFWWLGLYRGGSPYGDPGASSSTMILRFVTRGTGQGSGDILTRLDLHDATKQVPIGEPFKLSIHIVEDPPRARVWLGSDLLCDTDDGVIQGASTVAMGWGSGTPITEVTQWSTWGGGNGGPADDTHVMLHFKSAVYAR